MIILTLRCMQDCSTEGFNTQESNSESELYTNCENITVSLVCKEAKP